MNTQSIDQICEYIVTHGGVEAREWAASQVEKSDARVWVELTTRQYYEAGAERFYLGGLRIAEVSRGIDLDNIVVQIPEDRAGRRKIYMLLCEHLCERVSCCENPQAYLEDPDRYFGDRYCLFRFDELMTDPDIT